jgi:hypothetical protein
MARCLRLFVILALGVVAGAACSSPPVKAVDFEPTYKAASAITSATGVGVGYAAFSDLVRTLAAELDLARVKASTPEEQSIVDAADRAIAAYKDSLAVWSLKIQEGAIISRHVPSIVALAAKYDISQINEYNYRADDVLQAAWSRGAAAVDELKKVYQSGLMN